MQHGRMVFVLGNVNGQFDLLDAFIDEIVRQNEMLRGMAALYEEEGGDFQAMILQCGDFLWFWPGDGTPVIHNQIEWLSGGRIPLYWVGGNHEDWDRLDALGPGISETGPSVFYCPFGTTMTLSPDAKVLFAGGAECGWKDKKERLCRMKDPDCPKIWWEQEGISDADMERLALVPKADWVISHTAPKLFDLKWAVDEFYVGREHFSQPSPKTLDRVFKKYNPKRWFFGHFHHFMQGKADGCKWECLANIGSGDRFWDKVWMEWED